MKALPPIFCALLLTGATLSAQDDATANAPLVTLVEPGRMTDAAREAQARYSLKDDKTKQNFANLMQTGANRLAQKRVQEALEAFNEAELIWPEYPELLNMKGAALVNIRDFDRATEYFGRALELYPSFWQAKFNLAEMHFVRGKFKDSLELFTGLLGNLKDLDVELDAMTRRLVDYKMILLHIKLDESQKAANLIANYDLFDDTPIFYYSNAAVQFHAGEEVKGQEWVMKARSVYSPEVNNLFEDSLMELGWMFNF